ncbi:ligand-dependent nuclear receptor-interacting factor 1 [Falco rusticolus]|uniref:ligand-dependent nuclear receptor-interacting factor 1 n=1 Tax=Falco rusticolus TaxID=120794 RepID=UPI00188688EE|nr:ligand-dependent nuclear receptor-interacting factor 1 [Falco rusticolus]
MAVAAADSGDVARAFVGAPVLGLLLAWPLRPAGRQRPQGDGEGGPGRGPGLGPPPPLMGAIAGAQTGHFQPQNRPGRKQSRTASNYFRYQPEAPPKAATPFAAARRRRAPLPLSPGSGLEEAAADWRGRQGGARERRERRGRGGGAGGTGAALVPPAAGAARPGPLPRRHVPPPAGGPAEPRGAAGQRHAVVQCEKMDSLRKVIQIKYQEKPHWKQYLELRKKFGLSKEERVYLRRIPLRTSCETPEERVCSSNSLKRENDSCSSSSLDVEVISQHRECVKEEKVIVDLEEELTKKRKIKPSPLSDSRKRRKTSVKSTASPSSENISSGAGVLNKSVSPPPVSSQHSVSTDFVTSSPGKDSEPDPYGQYSDLADLNIPVLVSGEVYASVPEGSFRNDAFPLTPPDLDETIRDEKIKRLKQLLREREAALEEVRKKNAAELKY